MRFCLWITGLPGSGKSTIAQELEPLLREAGYDVLTLSLDQVRKVLTPEPKYTDEERALVYRSLAFMAGLMVQHSGKNVIIDATANRRAFRDLARALVADFGEVYVRCPLEVCQARESARTGQAVEPDLYEKALAGRLKGDMPGVSTPYEEPMDPEVEVRSDRLTAREAAEKILAYVRSTWPNRIPKGPFSP
jgi:adenylylsulfate kinase